MADKECKNCKYVLTSNKYVPFVCSRTGTPTSEAWRCDLFEPTTPTNADRIRSMTDEELGKFLGEIAYHCSNEICDYNCPLAHTGGCANDNPQETLEWLKSPAEKDGET